MKRTFRKIRAAIRRSPVTKFMITFLLTGAGILAFMVMAGETDPETMSFVESLKIRACAATVMIADIVLFKIAYKNHLLTNDIYREMRADSVAIKQED